MKRFLLDPVAWVFTIFIAGLSLVIMGASTTYPVEPNLGSTVEVVLPEGHGSGVGIGNDLYLTAAHVAQDGTTVKLRFSDGRVCKAEGIWTSKAYDVTMLKAQDCGDSQSSPLACRPLSVGENIRIIGSPSIADHIQSWGKVASTKQEIGPWREAHYADISIAGGNSGGPVFDQSGNVVGLAVGGLLSNLNFSTVPTGWGIIIPSETICLLLARGA